MKRTFIYAGVIVFVVMFLFGGCGKDPIAKVFLKGELTRPALWSGGNYELSWVDILEVYDWEDFEDVAEKISKDRTRANINRSVNYKEDGNGEWDKSYFNKDRIYYIYPDEYYLMPAKKSYLGRNLFCWLLFTLFITYAVRPRGFEEAVRNRLKQLALL